MSADTISTAIDTVSAAKNVLVTEKKQIISEIEAFKLFEKRVSRIDPDTGMLTHVNQFDSQQGSTGEKFDTIRVTYSETVMSVAHYEEEYGDTYQASLKEEFGPDLASALTGSSEFAPIHKSTLLTAIQRAITTRRNLKNRVELEEQSIDSALSDIRHITEELQSTSQKNFEQNPHTEILDASQVQDIKEELDNISIKRQKDIHNIRNSIHQDTANPDIHSYLYQSMPITHPVLATIGEIAGEIEELS